MAVDPRYEAWRNLLLILAGVLVADALADFSDIQQGIRSLLDFDKALSGMIWPQLLTCLVVVYVAKNAHGILVTLFDDAYYEHVSVGGRQVFMWCLLTTSVVFSFAVVVRLGDIVREGSTVVSRGGRLMLIALLPSVILLVFDLFHLKVFRRHETLTGISELARSVFAEAQNPIRLRRDQVAFRRIWLLEDFVTLVVIFLWWLLATFVLSTNTQVIITTVVALAFSLLINSVGDYFLNFNYYFFAKEASSSGSTVEEIPLV